MPRVRHRAWRDCRGPRICHHGTRRCLQACVTPMDLPRPHFFVVYLDKAVVRRSRVVLACFVQISATDTSSSFACRAAGPAGGHGMGSSATVKHAPPKGVEAPAIAAPERQVKFPPAEVATPAPVPEPLEGRMNSSGLNGLTVGGTSGLQTVRCFVPGTSYPPAPRILHSFAQAESCMQFLTLPFCWHPHCPSHIRIPVLFQAGGARYSLLTCFVDAAFAGRIPSGGDAAHQLHHSGDCWPAGPRQRGVKPF